ncbi:type VII secretion protein EccB [Actinoplanes sp. GCM10030250]|uniref:type VII secretion protein EccB n=1 Tax=Actinoplanes sp. GCM10030250 TaxID=3273376 RepID=UPI0036225AD1
MTSRRDQLQSYQFRNQRVISAFVMRETDPAQSPLRRGIGALFGGLMIAVLVAAGFGIHGLLTGTGDNRWQSEGSVVVERETGASFVYLDDKLIPTLNFTSAKLASGRPDPPVFRIAAKDLTGTPRGVTIGIAGAPASLPDASRQVRLPWTICTVPGDNATSVLLVASSGPDGTPLADRGLLVTDGDLNHLVVQGRKHRIRNARTTIPALFGATQPTRVGAAWLTTLPSGTDIAPIAVDDRGDPSGAVDNSDNGDVLFTETGSGKQFYLVLDDGLAPITPLQQAVLQAAFPADPQPVSVNDVAQAPESKAVPADNAPPAVPQLAPLPPAQATCATTTTPTDPPTLTVDGSPSTFANAIPTTDPSAAGPLADAIQVPAGTYSLLRTGDTFQLIADQALRHPLPTADAVALLGYRSTDATEIPPPLLATVPTGVTLDPAAARSPAATPN